MALFIKTERRTKVWYFKSHVSSTWKLLNWWLSCLEEPVTPRATTTRGMIYPLLLAMVTTLISNIKGSIRFFCIYQNWSCFKFEKLFLSGNSKFIAEGKRHCLHKDKLSWIMRFGTLSLQYFFFSIMYNKISA